MSAGHNWIGALTHFAATSGILAGFSVAFIALIMGGKVADTDICLSGITFGQVSVLLFGISSVVFIFACQRFLHAHEFNIWRLPDEYVRLICGDLKVQKEKWDKLLLDSDASCRKYEKEGRLAYDSAILFTMVGLFFMIVPYSLAVAAIVLVLGGFLEAWQYLR